MRGREVVEEPDWRQTRCHQDHSGAWRSGDAWGAEIGRAGTLDRCGVRR